MVLEQPTQDYLSTLNLAVQASVNKADWLVLYHVDMALDNVLLPC